MKYSAKQEGDLMARLWSPEIADDPYKFVMYAFPWGKAGTPLEGFTGPREWQKNLLLELRDHIAANKDPTRVANLDFKAFRKAVASGRGIGKSALEAWLALWMLTTRVGSSVICSANSEAQLQGVLWGELTKWTTLSINAHWWEITATRITAAPWLAERVETDLGIGTKLWSANARLWSAERPDSYAGVHNFRGVLVIFDEASSIPDQIWTVAAGFFTEPTPHRFWVAFSNPRALAGYYYEIFNGSRGDFWSTSQINALDVEGVDHAIHREIIAENGEESYQAAVEVRGEFWSQDDLQFINPKLVQDAFERTRWDDETAPIVIGVDPARYGSDSTCIAIRKGRDLLKVQRFNGQDTMETVGRIIDAIYTYNPAIVAVDQGGLGAGIVDRLMEQRFKQVKGVDFGWSARNGRAYANKRAEIWGLMKDWLATASIPADKRIKSDLCGPQLKLDSTGRIGLEGKKEMRARGVSSPDAADAIALTFAHPVNGSRPDIPISRFRNAQNYGGPGGGSWMAS